MVALVDDEGVSWDGFRGNFVGIEEEEDFGFRSGNFLTSRDKTDIEGRWS